MTTDRPEIEKVSGHSHIRPLNVMRSEYISGAMSYTLTLRCGCVVYVACHPVTRLAHTRIIERRGRDCRERVHETGTRLWLWEMLPDPKHQPDAEFLSSTGI